MITLDEEKILDTARKVGQTGKENNRELFELLGGEELYSFFDKQTVKSMVNNIVTTEKVHQVYEETAGFEVLEGLLNKEIVGDMEKFYNIKPEYILELPPEEQAKMAHSFSKENKVQEELLKMFGQKV